MNRYESGRTLRETKRKSFMTFDQKQALLEFIKKHHELYFGKHSPTFTIKQSRELWQDIADSLNSIPHGTHKTWYQWRKAWQDIKTKNKSVLNSGREKYKSKLNSSNNSEIEDRDIKSHSDDYEDIGDPMVQFVECNEHDSIEFLEDCKDDVNEALRHCLPENSPDFISISKDNTCTSNEQIENNYLQGSNCKQEEREMNKEEENQNKNYKSLKSRENFREVYYKKKLALMERDVIAKERIAYALENIQFR